MTDPAAVVPTSGRRPTWPMVVVVSLPFVVAAVALAVRTYAPVLDLAMTEVRVRDVFGRHSPLIGLPGRIGSFPDQGSHPGPLSFYLLAPFHRLTGGTAVALLVGATALQLASALGAVWVAGRRSADARRAVAVVVVVLTAWLGASVLTQPWNPYLPLMTFLFALVCTWSVVDGDHVMLVPLTLAASFCAQTHVPYLSLGVALVGTAFVATGWRWWRSRCIDRAARRSVMFSVGLGALVWSPVFVDQWRRTPGNISMLRRHFLDPPEDPVGWVEGARVVLAHLDPVRVLTGLAERDGSWLGVLRGLEGGSWVIGLGLLAVWAAVAVRSRRLADKGPWHLHQVVAVGLFIAVVSSGRIFGKVWYYLVLWAWVIGAVAIVAVVLTIVAARRARALPVTGRTPTLFGSALLGVVLLVSVVDSARVDPPEDHLSRVLAALVPPTVAAISDGTVSGEAMAGTYLVRFQDAASFGSQAYGLVSELERAGIDARMTPTYRVPMTIQRTIAPDDPRVSAELVLVSGSYLDEWRERSDADEVVAVDLRTESERVAFEALRSRVLTRLADVGLADVAALVDTNLFGASLDQRLPDDVASAMADMLVLGQETAVFAVAPGVLGE